MKLFASLAANPDPPKSGLRLSQRLDRHSFKQIMYRVGSAIAAVSLPLILATPSQAVLTQLLKRGSRGGQVYELQEQLNRLGYRVPVDGVFGSETENAVRQYQEACRLAVDGIVGSDTRTRLNKGDTCGRRGSSGSYTDVCIGIPYDSRYSYNSYRRNSYADSDPYFDDFNSYASANSSYSRAGLWTVLVPGNDFSKLDQAQRYNPGAFINRSDRFGPYIQVGVFDDKYRAECVYRTLQRNYGLRDAHMRYGSF
ncbi:MAG TPA: peptidoglycan-binding protein [Leptolyngbyaceae cyanobacterium M33_DOE_097]|uniref:Peptidoglycan-binding protein n=1 Tax=Oscillatoriales cyanobacterium SpSt-418 TaxID=2282169 RepID=A0A7C3PPU6_9CYAN|nr:peptidoglycan-binding protein [Leptolyngbyaceae cyanobacterium M33_DOE_097]